MRICCDIIHFPFQQYFPLKINIEDLQKLCIKSSFSCEKNIYINDVSIDIISTVNLFADETSPFSIIHDAKTTAYELNKDLQKNRHINGKCHLIQT